MSWCPIAASGDSFSGRHMRGVQLQDDESAVRLTAAAGEPWDELVEMTVAENLAGLECLSGIPGWVGATPIQNVGAYGQDVATVIEAVHVLDLMSLEEKTLGREECGFGYGGQLSRVSEPFPRSSGRHMRWNEAVVQRSSIAELRRAIGIGETAPSLAEVAPAVLDLRRSKSMVLEEGIPIVAARVHSSSTRS